MQSKRTLNWRRCLGLRARCCRLVAMWLLAVSGAWLWAGDAVVDLRVMSFNIWVNGGTSLSQCVEAIRISGADVVGLQECNAATAQTIAANLDFHFLGVNDVSIVSRYPILGAWSAEGGSGVTLALSPSQRAHLFNCHLAAYPYGPYSIQEGRDPTFVLNQEEQTRMPALTRLLESMAAALASGEPCFLAGDFNAPSHLDYADYPWPTSIACYNAGLRDAYRVAQPGGRTYPPAFAFDEPGITWTPMVAQEPNNAFDRIDFVYFSDGDGITVLECSELDGRNSADPWPSDHRAVLARLGITPPTLADKATVPLPPEGATNVGLTPFLSWVPGSNTLSHRLYFGTNAPGTFQTEQTNQAFSPGALLSGTTYFWRVDEVEPSGVVTGDVWTFTTRGVLEYEWNFAHGDLSPALGPGILAYADGVVTSNLTRFGVSDGVSVPHMGGQPTRYMQVPAFAGLGNGYHVTLTSSRPNGGGVYINQFTMIWDLLIPGPLDWTPLFNTNPENANDADFYVDPAGALGIGAIGYSSAGVIHPGAWHRVAFVADLAASRVTYYVDGNQVASGAAGLDGRHSLYSDVDPGPDILLFNEGDTSGIYTHPLYLSSFYFTERTLSAAELQALGGPQAGGIAAPAPPLKVSVTLQGNTLQLSWTGGEGPYRVQQNTDLVSLDWQDVAGPTLETNLALPLTGTTGFFRVSVE